VICRSSCIFPVHFGVHKLLNHKDINLTRRKIDTLMGLSRRKDAELGITVQELSRRLDRKRLDGSVGDTQVVFSFAANALAVFDKNPMRRKVGLVASDAAAAFKGQLDPFGGMEEHRVFLARVAFFIDSVHLKGVVPEVSSNDGHCGKEV
jgi:hypothetical protein